MADEKEEKEISKQHEKVAFVWEEPRPLVQVPTRLFFRSLDKVGMKELVATVAQSMTGSFDRSDQKKVHDQGTTQAALQFLAEAADYFDYQIAWWQVAYDQKGHVVGFLQPVTFRGCSKDGLEEGTLYYIGVVPAQRGKHYIYDLLLQATSILQQVGVWRIYCDTDVLNQPMIQAFRQVGYRQEGDPYLRPL